VSAPAFTTGDPRLNVAVKEAATRLATDGARAFTGKSPEERLRMAREALAATMPVMDQRAARELGRGIACGDRCPACCIYTKQVAVLPLELTRILDLVEREGRLEEVAHRAELRQARGTGTCPLLSRNGRCAVYAERPLNCRRYHSLSREECKADDARIGWITQLVAAGMALQNLAQWDGKHHVDLFAALPGAAAARLKQAKKRQRRAARART
jgi:Fe-S-cluster containining protein